MIRRVLLDRDLTHAWLDAAMGLAASGIAPEAARSALHERLRDDPLGDTARAKTVTALMRTWISPPPAARPLLRWAATHSTAQPDSRPLHIGALLATQPFFADQASIVGRILAVQDDVDTPVVRSRMKAIWGPRRSVDIAVQRTIKTMRALGMLEGLASDSRSMHSDPIAVDPQVGGWLVGCLLAARGTDSISASELASAPELSAIVLPLHLDTECVGLRRFAEGAGRTVFVSGAGVSA